MDHFSPWKRHTATALCMACVALAGCSPLTGLQPPATHAGASPTATEPGPHCHRQGNALRGRSTCTQAAVPPPVHSQALAALPADPQAMTVYVLRDGWGDIETRVHLAVDDQTLAETVPRSYVRLRLKPGAHRLHLHWPAGRWTDTSAGSSAPLEVQGAAGSVQVLSLNGRAWAWQTAYALQAWQPAWPPTQQSTRQPAQQPAESAIGLNAHPALASARQRTAALRLVGDARGPD